MIFNRDNRIYANGLMAEKIRERVSNVPLRYRHHWIVYRVVEFPPTEVHQHEHFTTMRDDTGERVHFAYGEVVGSDLTKRQAAALLARGTATTD